MSIRHNLQKQREAKQWSDDFISKYDPETHREGVRGNLASALVAMLAAVIAYMLYSTHGDYGKALVIFDKLLPVISGLIGSAIGFYFGSVKPGR